MSLTSLTLWLHITVMVTAITISYGPALVVRLAYRTGEVAVLRGISSALQPIERVIPPVYVVGGLLGLWTAINFGYNLLAPWLVIAYVLFAVAMVQGITYNGPFAQRLQKATAEVPDGPLTPPITALFTTPRYRISALIDYLVVIGILFDMVVKPFS